jgi:tripartite-type tricarboxylate transporter receptor subunit TctC
MKTSKTVLAYSVFLALLFLLPAFAFSQAPFYQGKTITIINATEPGGTGDLRVRPLVPFLRKYIPGNPTIVVEYMPGGGGRKAANHIYTVATPDGLTIGAMLSGTVPAAILGESGVFYDVDKLIYLGASYRGVPYVFVTRKEAGLGGLEKLRSTPGVRIGAQSVGHIVYYTGRLFAYLIGMKDPKFVTGYSGPEVDLALIRGEVDARANIPDTILRRNRDWIDKGLVDFHAFIEVPKGKKHQHPAFANLPDLEGFAKSARERKLLELYRVFAVAASPLILPPKTPKERVQILQAAARRAFNDPEFHKEFERLTGDDAAPLMPEELEKAVRELPRDPEVIDLFKTLVGPAPLPSR